MQASLRLKRQVGHRSGEIVTLTQLGALRARQGAFEAALGYLQEAWDIGIERGTPRSQFTTLAELGEAARRQGDSAVACAHFTAMVRLATTADIPPRIILQGLYYLALFHQQRSLCDETALLTGFLSAQPGSLKKTRDEVQVLAAQLESQLSAPEVQRLQTAGSAASLAQILVRQLSVLERGSLPA